MKWLLWIVMFIRFLLFLVIMILGGIFQLVGNFLIGSAKKLMTYTECIFE